MSMQKDVRIKTTEQKTNTFNKRTTDLEQRIEVFYLQ